MVKLLFAILLCALPVVYDLFIGRVYWRNKTTVQHMLTASGRLIIMFILAWANPSVEWWRSIMLTFAFHYFVFPILYNRLIVMRPWDYISASKDAAWFDKAEGWLRWKIGTLAVITSKIMFLAVAIQFYINKAIFYYQAYGN